MRRALETSRTLRPLSAMIGITLAVLALLAWQGAVRQRQSETAVARSLQVTALAGQVRELDQALTLSAHLAIVSHDPVWLRFYQQHANDLDAVLRDADRLSADPPTRRATAQIDRANRALLGLEARAMALAERGDTAQARALLTSREYARRKTEYAAGVRALLTALRESVDATQASQRQEATNLTIVSLAAWGVLGASWILVHRLIGRYENRQRQVHQALLASYEQIESMVTAMAEGVLLADPAERIIRINDSAALILGASVEAVSQSPISDWLPGMPDGPASAVRIERTSADQERQILRVNAIPLADVGRVITFRDVTLEESTQNARSAFVSTASHELRTPIGVISGYVELLQKAQALGLDPARRDQILTTILTQTRRLARTVDVLLKLTRLDAGHAPVQPRAVSPEAVLEEALLTMALPAQSKMMRLAWSRPGQPLPALSGDPDLVREILINLLDNAIKYAPAGTTVTVTTAAVARYIRFTVIDQGPGIATADQARIFERFFRVPTPASRVERGTGLGLAISRELAEIQGGTLLLSSEPGKGSTFALTLPQIRANRQLAA